MRRVCSGTCMLLVLVIVLPLHAQGLQWHVHVISISYSVATACAGSTVARAILRYSVPTACAGSTVVRAICLRYSVPTACAEFYWSWLTGLCCHEYRWVKSVCLHIGHADVHIWQPRAIRWPLYNKVYSLLTCSKFPICRPFPDSVVIINWDKDTHFSSNLWLYSFLYSRF